MSQGRPRVYKMKTFRGFVLQEQEYMDEKPWVAIHPAGNMRFDTWREAYDYARTPLIMWNRSPSTLKG